MSSKQTEDLMYEIHTELTQSGLMKQFHKECKKLSTDPDWKWKEISDRWEHARQIVKKKKK